MRGRKMRPLILFHNMAKHKQITEISIDEEDLDIEFRARVNMSNNDVNWSAGAIFKKTLSSNTTLTFTVTEDALNKTITLLITGNYSLTMPSTVKIISGEYDGSVENYIQIHCVYVDENNEGYNEYWATISQEG